MKKIINFSDQQVNFIVKSCKDKEISFTEMIKRIVDEFMEKHLPEKDKSDSQ
jgi:hypothetical protein